MASISLKKFIGGGMNMDNYKNNYHLVMTQEMKSQDERAIILK